VADRNMKISRDYGVLIEEEGIALRGLFVIDPKGVLRYATPLLSRIYCLLGDLYRQITVNDLPVGRSVDETLRLIKAFQFTVRHPSLPYLVLSPTLHLFPQDKHGEVCPANWTEGAKTIKTTPHESLEYFSTVGTEPNGTAKASKRMRVD
jgi:peroxiredoxin (alkyl hydroperoxide reductase subunit C)